ncbi:uncharacterized protein LOC142097915 [Mixophyes fleayi]|uniref:uncharacterized protein LOC142097915 n=1 Tax=Mixophyes fleayi TaxID=3061075 RepID=UPI003F4DA574
MLKEEASACNFRDEPEWDDFTHEVICTMQNLAKGESRYNNNQQYKPDGNGLLQHRDIPDKSPANVLIESVSLADSTDPLETMSMEELIVECQIRGVPYLYGTHRDILKHLLKDQENPINAFSVYRKWMLTLGPHTPLWEQMQCLQQSFEEAEDEVWRQGFTDTEMWQDQCYRVNTEKCQLEYLLSHSKKMAAQSVNQGEGHPSGLYTVAQTTILGETGEELLGEDVVPLKGLGEILPFGDLDGEELPSKYHVVASSDNLPVLLAPETVSELEQNYRKDQLFTPVVSDYVLSNEVTQDTVCVLSGASDVQLYPIVTEENHKLAQHMISAEIMITDCMTKLMGEDNRIVIAGATTMGPWENYSYTFPYAELADEEILTEWVSEGAPVQQDSPAPQALMHRTQAPNLGIQDPIPEACTGPSTLVCCHEDKSVSNEDSHYPDAPEVREVVQQLGVVAGEGRCTPTYLQGHPQVVWEGDRGFPSSKELMEPPCLPATGQLSLECLGEGGLDLCHKQMDKEPESLPATWQFSLKYMGEGSMVSRNRGQAKGLFAVGQLRVDKAPKGCCTTTLLP